MGKESEEEMISLLLYKEIAMIICMLVPLILYKSSLLSLCRSFLLGMVIISVFVIVGEKIVQLAASKRRNTCKPGSSISNSDARKKHTFIRSGACTEIRGYSIDGLSVSAKEIAKGSNGSVVFEGVYEGRNVAVKRLVKARHNEALKEVQHLIASDQHPNIVRWHGVKCDKDYVYLALERCICSLSELISLHLDPHPNSAYFFRQAAGMPWSNTMQNIDLWKGNGYPSALLLKLMRDMVYGLVHLHKLSIIHQDIKPQNVMIAKGKDICAKLSDIGISKCLPSDKSSSSQNAAAYGSRHQRWAADMYSLGSVFYFCLTRGGHSNIRNNGVSLHLLDHVPEAVDLLSHLLHSDPKMRPKAYQVLHHPLFWDSERRLSFLRDVSDRLKLESRDRRSSTILIALESVAQRAFGTRWDKKMEPALIKDINHCSRYRYKSVQHLLRVVRNKLNHYHESPRNIQELLGSMPEGIDNYFSSRFPRLLMEVYKVIISYCRLEICFQKYFGIDSAPIV